MRTGSVSDGFSAHRVWNRQNPEASPGLAERKTEHTGSPKQGKTGRAAPLSSALSAASACSCRLHLSLSHVLLCRPVDSLRDESSLINNSPVDFLLSATDAYNLDNKFVVSEPLVELFLRNLPGERAIRRDRQVPPGTVGRRAGDRE